MDGRRCRVTSIRGTPSRLGRWKIVRPFGVTQTKLPGIQIANTLPKQAAMLDKFTILRSVDARHSSHQPNMVFQSGNLEAAPRHQPQR